MKTIYVVTGQTATGKTDYALELAQKSDGELINCDSRQIYKDLDIVTGKDINQGTFTVAETVNGCDIGYYTVLHNGNETKVWLYDIISPDKTFSAAEYAPLALQVIKNILDQGKTPVIVGGTYFYLMHLLYKTPQFQSETNWALRKALEEKTVEELQKILQQKNSHMYKNMNTSDRSNPHRLIRRIEVAETTNREEFEASRIDKTIILGEKTGLKDITIDITGFYRENREITRNVIRDRVKKRIEQGAVEETRQLLERYDPSSPGLKSIGYSQIVEYLEKKLNMEQLIEDWTNKEYQYAKRQYTFMKTDKYISWKNIP